MSDDRDPLFVGEKTEAAFREFDAQGRIEPGTEGWWTVYGGRVQDVRSGDLVLVKGEPGVEAMLVDDVFRAKAWPMRQGWVVDGEQLTMGSMVPVAVLRRGTKGTLAE